MLKRTNPPSEDEDWSTDSDSEGYRPCNRGNKLKRLKPGSDSDNFRVGLMSGLLDSEDLKVVKTHFNGKSAIVNANKAGGIPKPLDPDPFKGIKIEELISPLDSPSDIFTRPTVRAIFNSPILSKLSSEIMTEIESSKSRNNISTKLQSYLTLDLFPPLSEEHYDEYMSKELTTEAEWNDIRNDVVKGVAVFDEYIKMMGKIREKLVYTHEKKKTVYRDLYKKGSSSEGGRLSGRFGGGTGGRTSGPIVNGAGSGSVNVNGNVGRERSDRGARTVFTSAEEVLVNMKRER